MDPLYYRTSIAAAGDVSLGPLFDVPAAPPSRPGPRERPRTPASVVPGHHTTIATSRAWAERQAPKFGSKLDKVWRFIEARGAEGATRQEIADALGAAHDIPINVVCPAVVRLRDALRLVVERGERNGGAVLVAAKFAPAGSQP